MSPTASSPSRSQRSLAFFSARRTAEQAAVAHELAGEGAFVVVGARSVAPLEGIENVTPFAVDLVDPDGPACLIAEAIERYGRIDVLVDNVGGVHLRLDVS